MKQLNKDYYEKNAADVCRRYESALPDESLALLRKTFPANGKILELGCGSGRDGAYLLHQGFNWWGIEGADAMAREAVRIHPELKGRIIRSDMVHPFPFSDNTFHGIFSFGALMHLTAERIPPVLEEIRRVSQEDARLAVSIPLARTDVDEKGFTRDGRYFLPWGKSEWTGSLEAAGFAMETSLETRDVQGRNMSWLTLVARRKRGEES